MNRERAAEVMAQDPSVRDRAVEVMVKAMRGVPTLTASALAALDALLAAQTDTGPLVWELLDDGGEHIAKFRDGSWTLQHPLHERLSGSLFDCNFTAAMEELDGPPADGDGIYSVVFDVQGNPVFAPVPSPPHSEETH